ncbi:hypothetical protein [Pollutimonas bauzanensis]|uniref:Uncharacterized protein n=1 Tax=Pollutimonas bauzanensis TaxID=658167 RepID=A0A1M5Z8T3_9BURK|nr:hypothetical protein [Pollutimonas bauzanensis]SHI20594.1 hypothetical protein SAMN04488135_11328 [Pollutimonas bauzanensis]
MNALTSATKRIRCAEFATALDPTLETGLRAMLTAASAWLCEQGPKE